MKKNKHLFIVIFSFIVLILSINSLREYYYIKKGNIAIKELKFDEAKSFYEKALRIKERVGTKSNLVKVNYASENYDKVIAEEHEEYFIKGNSIIKNENKSVKIKEENSENKEEKNKEIGIKEALLEYKKQLKTSEDINIKKNYEIVLEKIKNQNKSKDKQEQQDQDKDKQEEQKQDKDKQEEQKQDKDKQEEQKQDKDKQEEQKQDKDKQEEQKQD
ncbi:MAG: hypothetical protein ACRC6K_08105, partial [Fusobacteriaceae bacterium]